MSFSTNTNNRTPARFPPRGSSISPATTPLAGTSTTPNVMAGVNARLDAIMVTVNKIKTVDGVAGSLSGTTIFADCRSCSGQTVWEKGEFQYHIYNSEEKAKRFANGRYCVEDRDERGRFISKQIEEWKAENGDTKLGQRDGDEERDELPEFIAGKIAEWKARNGGKEVAGKKD